ncbi:hypothetical protein D3C87_1346050 [compost metagenome]
MAAQIDIRREFFDGRGGVIADDGGNPRPRIGRHQRNRRTRPAPHGCHTGMRADRISKGFGLEKHQRIHARFSHQLLGTASVDIAHGNPGDCLAAVFRCRFMNLRFSSHRERKEGGR